MRKAHILLLVMIFLDLVSFAFLLPVIPLIVKELWWQPYTVWLINWAAAFWMFFWWILFWKLSDNFWRKKTYLATRILNVIWYLIFAFTWSIPWLVVSRLFCWLWGWWISVAQAYISDTTLPTERLQIFSKIWLITWLWLVIWPVLSSVFWRFEIIEIWLFSAFVMFASFIIWLFLKEPQTYTHEETIKIKSSHLLFVFVSYMLINITLTWIQTILPLHLNNIFGFTKNNMWYIFWYMWLISWVYILFVLEKLQKYLKEKHFISWWMFFWWILVILLGYNTNIWWLYIIAWLLAVCIAWINSSLFSLISKSCDRNRIWAIFWLNLSFWSVWDIWWALIAWFSYSSFPYLTFIIIGIMLITNWCIFSKKLKSNEPQLCKNI